MGKKKLRQRIIFMNYQNRRWGSISSRICRSLEEVKKTLNKS